MRVGRVRDSEHLRASRPRRYGAVVAASRRPGTLRWVFFSAFLLAGVALLSLRSEPASAGPPSDFSDTLVTDVGLPTALAFTPDKRMLITTQGGGLRVYEGGELLATPALSIPTSRICANSERGLLGVAVDPSFAANDRVYLFYTFKKSSGSCVNRVSRFTLSDSNVVDAASEQVLVDNMPSPNGNHNAGDLNFGKDGNLYISIGDGGCDYAGNSGCAGQNDAARDQHVLTGKILRITADGGIPSDNPFQGAGTARCNVTGQTTSGNKCQETFAWGLRNPFRMAFDPNAEGTRFFINDVGQNAREEIDEGQAGADYGWNCREGTRTNSTSGPCNPNPPSMVSPVFEYSHGTNPELSPFQDCNSITGGAFVPEGLWPGFDGAYLFGDYVCGKIFKLTNSGGTWAASNFVTGLGSSSAVHLAFGPYGNTQALYYTTYANGGQVRSIVYDPPGNVAPKADIKASQGSENSLTVNFDGSGSGDPDPNDTLTYLWDFTNDGTVDAATTTPTTAHTYGAKGTYTAALRVRDNQSAVSDPDTVTVTPGNAAPSPTITAPAADLRFRVGQEITLAGGATDPEDGTLPPDALKWEIIGHHNGDHVHGNLFSAIGSNSEATTFTAPPPEDLFATDSGNYLEIRLTATDSDGNSRTVSQRLDPRRVNVTFKTLPKNKPNVTVNGETIDAPKTLTSWEGYELNVNATSPQKIGRRNYVFASWSDGGPASHTTTTPPSARTYTATFKR